MTAAGGLAGPYGLGHAGRILRRATWGCDQLLCNDVNCTDVFTTGVDALAPFSAQRYIDH